MAISPGHRFKTGSVEDPVFVTGMDVCEFKSIGFDIGDVGRDERDIVSDISEPITD